MNNQKLTDLLSLVEKIYQRKFNYKYVVSQILDNLKCKNDISSINNLIFYSKFLHNTLNVIKKGIDNIEGFDKLQIEFEKKLESVAEILRNSAIGFNVEVKETFETEYLSKTAESFGRLVILLEDLSWLKNFEIDTKNKLCDMF